MDKILRPKLVPLIITLLGIPVFLLAVAAVYYGTHVLRQSIPLQDASMMIKNELVRFHSSLERYIYIDPSVKPGEVITHLDKAEEYTKKMLFGGRDLEWKYTPIEDPKLRDELFVMITKMEELRAAAEKRMAMRLTEKTDLELERKFDLTVVAITEQAERLEGVLHDTIKKEQDAYIRSIYALLAFCLLVSALAVTLLYKYLSSVKRTEEEIASARKFLGTVIDSVAEIIMVIDTKYNITLVNKTSGEFFEGKNVNCYEYSHGLDKPCESCWPCPMKQIIETGKPVMLEHEHLDKAGRRTLVEISAVPLKDDEGRVIGIIETSRDITEKKELERHKADFYAMVTHDLKSPLTSIIGYTELMQKAGNFDESTQEMLNSVHNSSEKLFRLVDDFLIISRMESGQKLQLAPGRICDALQEVASEFEPAARQKGVEFSLELPHDLHIAWYDKRGIQRAVSNLLQNAGKFTPSGGKVSLKAELRALPAGDYVEIAVSDTGPGISPEDQKKIFEKYYRAPKTSGIRGSGLGLAIVKAVIEAHGGRVELESEEGKGSTFRLLLPFGPAKG